MASTDRLSYVSLICRSSLGAQYWCSQRRLAAVLLTDRQTDLAGKLTHGLIEGRSAVAQGAVQVEKKYWIPFRTIKL
jgi:hypothetical protein